MYATKNFTPRLRWFKLSVAYVFLLSGFMNVQAAEPPDAGRLLREQPKVSPQLPRTPQIKTPQSGEQESTDNGATVLVKGFNIEGASLIPLDELQIQIQGAIGKTLSFSQLQAVADKLVAYYAQKGYLAQAVLPVQDVDDGTVLIKITEGKRGDVSVNNQGKRVLSDKVKGFIDYRLAEGETMSLNNLGEAINLLNEQAGVQVKATLKPGAESGKTDLLITASDKPLATFNFALSNNGSRGTGEAQAIAGVSFNNPSGLFDLASLLLVKSEGSLFGSGAYELAAGNSGLRVGANFSMLNYEVTQSSLRALDAQGKASTFGLKAEYPLYRLHDFGLSVLANADTKHLRDETVAGETSDRNVHSVTFGLAGNKQDGFGGGGLTGFGAFILHGHADEDNNAANTADRATRGALDTFGALLYNIDRQQRLGDDFIFAAKLRGQVAFNNIESSRRFSLGGADGIRAYPTGEAGADEGWLLSLNLIRPFTPNLNGTLFIDTGGVRVNKNTSTSFSAVNPSFNNSYTLTGAGAALDWKITEHLGLTAILAAPIGSNPGRDANNNDTDGRNQSLRGWINLIGQF